MQLMRIASVFIALLGCRGYTQTSMPAPVYQLRAKLARSHSIGELRRIHEKSAVHDRITELVFFTRWLSLSPKSISAARGLIRTIPSSEEEAVALMTLADYPGSGNISADEMSALDKVHGEWPRVVARATLLLPGSIKAYVSFLHLATTDMHSDFTGYAQKVCRKLPKQFRAAVAELPETERNYVRKYAFDAENCKPIFVSEAE